MIGLKTNKQRVSAIVMLLLLMMIAGAISPAILLMSSTIIWLTALLLITKYAHVGFPQRLATIIHNQPTGIISAIVILTLFWQAALVLHGSGHLGPQQLLYIMVVVWLADTGGYFAGKRWGKTALAKAISPNKSWEGVGGAVVLGTIWAIVAYSFGMSGQITMVAWVVLSIVVLLISVVGDLFESIFKRSHDVKDSGNLLPGHGGMLDRIDSLIAAVPVFVAGLYFMGAI